MRKIPRLEDEKLNEYAVRLANLYQKKVKEKPKAFVPPLSKTSLSGRQGSRGADKRLPLLQRGRNGIWKQIIETRKTIKQTNPKLCPNHSSSPP